MTIVSATSVPGIPSPIDRDPVGRLIASTGDEPPDRVVAACAEAMARARGGSLHGVGLRLFEGIESQPATVLGELATGELIHALSPYDLGHLHERLLDSDRRKRGGVHLTPAEIAAGIVELLEPDWMADDPLVLDPAVGGGAFLLASAERLVASGHSPSRVIDRLHGLDIDARAVAVAECSVALWGLGHGVEPRSLKGLVQGDGLLDALPAADVVVGNPPFLNQLRTNSTNAGDRRDRLRERFGEVVTSYTDEAWLFLVAAIDAAVEHAQVALVQPISVLAARHGAGTRARVSQHATLTGLWVSDGRVFAAAVEVCAPVLRRRSVDTHDGPRGRSFTRRWSGRAFEPHADLEPAADHESWGRAGAPLVGIPQCSPGRSASTVADAARTTAGFRDQFYGFAPYVVDTADPTVNRRDRLVTVGMIDPFRLRRSARGFRFAGGVYVDPRLDRSALRAADPALASWVEERLVPKVLVATQTRIIEATGDPLGELIPATPVISVEPNDPDDLWRLLAAISAPVIAADMAAANFGTALSVRALKLAAGDVARLPLPLDRAAWERGADITRRWYEAAEGPILHDERQEFAAVMGQAYGVIDEHIAQWWLAGWPQRETDPSGHDSAS
ncbi:MAG: N-6 DNA methylase [Actinomycetota bacterium]